MKLDKDTLLKNRFWLLLGAAALLTLIGWALLLVTVPSSAAKERASVEKKWSPALKGYSKFKRPEWVQQMEQEAKEFKDELSKVNKDLFESQSKQASVMSWPTGMEPYDFNNGYFAHEIKIQELPKAGKGGKTDALKGLPKDIENKQMSGILVKADSDFFEIETGAKGERRKFFRTNKISIKDKDPKLSFGQLSSRRDHPVTVAYTKGKYFGEDFTPDEIRVFKENYRSQLADVMAALGPVNILDEPVVQLRCVFGLKDEVVNECWVYHRDKLPPPSNRFFNYVPAWQSDVKNILSDEVWTAQENLWVQREFYKQMKAANDSLAVCELVKSDKDGRSATFKNYYWQLELAITKDGVEAQLKNLRPHPQNVDNLHFILRFSDPSDKTAPPSEPVLFPPKGSTFEGVAVGPTGGGNDVFPPKGSKFFTLPGASLGGVQFHSVEQVLTVDTAAVKRLDVLNIAAVQNTGEMAVGQRQGLKRLVAFDPKRTPVPPKKDPAAEPPPGGDPAAQGGAPAATDDPPVDEVANDAIRKMFTNNGLLLARYLEVTSNKARRLPVCVVMVVGPDHVARVEAALISSPLRFLETQVFLQRAVLTAGPAAAATKTASAPVIGSGKTASRGGGLGEGQENVELTIYGIVTLYDRPDRQAEKK